MIAHLAMNRCRGWRPQGELPVGQEKALWGATSRALDLNLQQRDVETPSPT